MLAIAACARFMLQLVLVSQSVAAANFHTIQLGPVEVVQEVWVDCETGSDTNAGTASSPLRTLLAARDALRRSVPGSRARQQALQRVVNIVPGGVCRTTDQHEADRPQDASLTLDARDSNTVWRAAAGGAVLSGGLPVGASSLQPLTASEKLLFKPSVGLRIMRLPLAEVDDVGRLKGLSYTGGSACIRSDWYEASAVELISLKQKATYMRLARHPDLAEGPPVTSNWADYRDPDNTNLAVTVDANAEQLEAWAQQISGGGAEIYSHGLWKFNWADSHRRVLSVANDSSSAGGARLSLQQHGDYTDRDCPLSAATPGAQGGHLYMYNSYWELDQPGEYVVDHKARTAFVYPHSAADAHELTVATALLTVDGATAVTFSGLSFRGARGVGIVVRNSTGVVVSNGAITDVGTSAFNVTGGADCGLLNMSVVRCGTGGVVLDGGDRLTLTRSNHFVKDSWLRECNRWLLNYSPLVLMAGVGQRVEGSVLSDAPQMAVFVQGNDHNLLDSAIRDVVQQCNDCGAYYFGRDWTYRGMRISGCNFSLPGPMWGGAHTLGGNVVASFAVYADDFGSSVAITGNEFHLGAGVPCVFESNCGRDHHFVGNTLRPLPPSANSSTSKAPTVNIGNFGCKGGDPKTCTGCLTGNGGAPVLGAALQASFLERVPFNTSDAWRRAFPKLYNFWQSRPCEAGGITITDNVVCFAEGSLSPVLNTTGSVVRNNSWVDSVCGSRNEAASAALKSDDILELLPAAPPEAACGSDPSQADKICTDFCSSKCSFYNQTVDGTPAPHNLTLYRVTPRNVTGIENKNTGDPAGDIGFYLSRKSLVVECREDPTNERCFLAGDNIFAQFVVEFDGQFGKRSAFCYESCIFRFSWFLHSEEIAGL